MKPFRQLLHTLLLTPAAVCLATGVGLATEVVQTNFAATQSLKSNNVLTFTLDQLPTPTEGQLVLFIGKTDVTALSKIEGNQIIYEPRLLPLPEGDATATLYLITPDAQRQTIAQFPLMVTEDSPIEKQEEPESRVPQSNAPNLLFPEVASPSSDTENTIEESPEGEPNTSSDPVTATLNEADKSEASQTADKSETSEITSNLDANASSAETEQEGRFPSEPENSPAIEEDNTKSAVSLTPRFNLSVNSQLLENTSGEAQPSERPTFIDTTAEIGFDLKAQAGIWNLNANANFLGVTNPEQALRFGEFGNNTPRFDLSDYFIENTIGPVTLSLGHQCYGNHPLLIDNFCSRGLGLKAKISDRIDISFSTLRSTSIVGFDDITGLQDLDNTIFATTLGFDLVKNNADGVRLELTYINGTRKAEDNFNVGEVVDAEKSDGFGIRLKGSDNSGRLRFDAAFARSRFTNPGSDSQLLFDDVQSDDGSFGENDELNSPFENGFNNDFGADNPFSEVEDELNQIEPVAVETAAKNAYFLEASYELFRNLKISKDKTFSLTVNGRHERIADQFQTLGTFVSTGQQQTLIGFSGELAGATFQFQQSWQEDNLDNIATILKTKTRSTAFSLGLPFKSIFNTEHFLVPSLNYSYQRVHQFGANVPIPERSGFDPTEIPDQVSVDHQLSAEWSGNNWSFSYNFSHSSQDNRQPTRERADFITVDHQFSASWQPISALQLSLGYNFNRAKSIEESITRFTHGPTLGLNWQFLPNASLALNYNLTMNSDSRNQSFARSDALEAALNWQFNLGSSTTGNAFLRYSRQTNLNRDNQFGFNSSAQMSTVTAGVSFSF